MQPNKSFGPAHHGIAVQALYYSLAWIQMWREMGSVVAETAYFIDETANLLICSDFSIT